MTSRIVRVLDGESLESPPIWLMRQAGRYLPEYRATRSRAKGFLDLCYTPELAIEVTLQPIRRFGFDAAILFSDILVIPDALGRKVRFEEGVGPLLDPIEPVEIDALTIEDAMVRLRPVIETVEGARGRLPEETTLLGFCGAPWTVATYMIAGQGNARPGAGPAVCLSRAEALREAVDAVGGCFGRLSGGATEGWCGCGADLRQLGGRAGRGRIRTLVHSAGQADRRQGAG